MKADDARNCVMFLHIEKAAGSTMHDIMYSNFLPYYVASPAKYVRGCENHHKRITPEQLSILMRPAVKAVGGHPIRCAGDYEKHGLYPLFFTFLRNPVERYLSHYFYQKDVMGIGWAFEDFLADPYCSNFMCKKIASVGDARAAIEMVEDKRVFLGLVEDFDRSLLALSEQINHAGLASGFDCHYVVKNSSVDRRGGTTAEKKVLLDLHGDQIKENNAEDIALYDYAVTNWQSKKVKPVSFRIDRNSLKSSLRIAVGKSLRRWWFVPREKGAGYFAG